MLTPKIIAAALALAIATPMAAAAATITVLNTSTPSASGYGTSNAIDTGANRLVTDYASNFAGATTHLDFAIVGTTNQVTLTDRTTGGGLNGTYVGGTGDFTTQFQLIFSNDPTFATSLASYSFTKAAPAAPTSPTDFLYIGTFANTSAAYVRYQVVAANGSAPGLADISFNTVTTTSSVPEPVSLMILGAGLVGLGAARARLRRGA